MISSFYLELCIGFILMQAFFNASEISFISSHLLKLHHRKDRGDKRAEKVYQLLHQPEKFLITTLVGTNLCLVLSSGLITLIFMHLGMHDNQLFTTVLFTPLLVIFAELIPKNIGRHFREDLSCWVVEVIFFFRKLFTPIIYVIEFFLNIVVQAIVGKERKRSLFITKEELKLIVKELEDQGSIDKGEKEAIEDVFNFKKLLVKDVCVKLDKVIVLDHSATIEDIEKTVKKEGYTRYLIAKSKEIIGYLNIYDIFYQPKEDWHNFIRPLSKIEGDRKVYEIFLQLKNNKENIALVVERDKVFGIITIADLMKEIIGSIME